MVLPQIRISSCAKCHASYPVNELNTQGKCAGCSKNKYNARKVTVNGRRYDSVHEADVVEVLYWRQAQKEICNLRRQVRFDFIVNGVRIGFYKADATYEENGILVVLDAKGKRTQVYAIKRKLMKACHDIDIVEL